MDYQLLFRAGTPLHLSLHCRRWKFGAVGDIPIVGKIATNIRRYTCIVQVISPAIVDYSK